jgi:Ca2+-binding RTX toxin-like protein
MLHAAFVIEALESRRLFAATFTAADYFPLAPGNTTQYEAFLNRTFNNGAAPSANPVGKEGTAWRVAALGALLLDPGGGGYWTYATVPVTRLRDTITTTGTPSETVVVDRFFHDDGRRGIRNYQIEIGGDSNVRGNIQQLSPLPTLPQRFGTGQVSTWTSLPTVAKLTIPGTPVKGQVMTGTDTGFTIVNADQPTETLEGFTLIQPIDVIIQQQQRYTLVSGGNTYRISVGVQEDWQLAKGVGLIAGNTTMQIGVVGPGQNTFVVFSEQLTGFTSSTLLSSFTKTTGSTLRVGGTTGNDEIGAGFDGSNILVVRNGVGVSRPAAGINRIVIDSSDGNDVVGPLKLGRMKSTLIGGKGNDLVIGGSGRDLIYGGDGNDILVGGPGLDTIFGEAGNDILNGLNGADNLDGGLGNDTTKRDDTDTRIAIEVLV